VNIFDILLRGQGISGPEVLFSSCVAMKFMDDDDDDDDDFNI